MEERALPVQVGVPVSGSLATERSLHRPRGDVSSHGEHGPFYYTSKFARLDALPRALDYGKVECLSAVRTYMGYVFEPPDGKGDPVENARHLRGACARLSVGTRSDNASLLLLNAFSLLVIEGSAADPGPSRRLVAESPAVRTAARNFRVAYRRFLASEAWPELISVLTVFSERLAESYPNLRPLLEGLHQECVLYRTVGLLRDVNRRLLDEPAA